MQTKRPLRFKLLVGRALAELSGVSRKSVVLNFYTGRDYLLHRSKTGVFILKVKADLVSVECIRV